MSKSLCVKIARCRNIGAHPCEKIASFQSNCMLKQMPEPWNGHLQKASIMFISSNPSIDFDELFPNIGWADDDIFDFFEERFVNGKIVRSTRKKASVRYWNSLIKYTNWINQYSNYKYFPKGENLQQRKDGDVSVLTPLVVSTEIVHCKSPRQIGIDVKCKDFCFKYIPEIIDEFTGDLIVMVGSIDKKYISSIKQQVQQRKQKTMLIKVPHPNDPSYPSDIDKEKAIKISLQKPILP